MVVVDIIFIALALATVYGVLIVPVYNFATRPIKARRDIFILVFSVIFTLVILQILWSVNRDVHRWLG